MDVLIRKLVPLLIASVGLCLALIAAHLYQLISTDKHNLNWFSASKNRPIWDYTYDEILYGPDPAIWQLAEQISNHFNRDLDTALKFASWIVEAAESESIDDSLLTGIIATESSFRVDVVSSAGAVGPSQIMPVYWEDYCESLDLYQPEDNIFCAAQIVVYLREQCEDESCVIKSYYIGYDNYINGRHSSRATRYYDQVQTYRDLLAVN